jgi:hypothetical protein
MRLANEAHDLERIAKAFRLIGYGGLANALLGVAIEIPEPFAAPCCRGKAASFWRASSPTSPSRRPRSKHSPTPTPSGPHLFDARYTAKDEGLGLGLSVRRKIVAAHGERIWLKKNTTRGATFTFALPVHQTSELSENN